MAILTQECYEEKTRSQSIMRFAKEFGIGMLKASKALYYYKGKAYTFEAFCAIGLLLALLIYRFHQPKLFLFTRGAGISKCCSKPLNLILDSPANVKAAHSTPSFVP